MPRRHFFTLILYTLLALLLTYPLVTQISTFVPGTATWSLDEYGYVWNNWWFKFALFDRGTNPFYSDYLFYPLGAPLVLYAYTLLHVWLALPLQFAFGLIPAVNATVLFSFILAAFGMYLFALYLLRVSLRTWAEKYGAPLGPAASNPTLHQFAAFTAGIAFAFTSSRFVYVSLGHYNIVASEWLPFYLLFFFKTLLAPRWRNALRAGLFAACALYTETTDGVLIALSSAVILVFARRLLKRAALARLGAMLATAAILFAPLLVPTLVEIFASGYSLPGWGHSEKLLVDLNGFFAPTSLHPLYRGWEVELDRVRQGISRFSDINTFFVGYATALLALLGFILFARRNRLWLAIILIFAVLSLGPLLHINGVSEFDLDGLTTTVPLPFLIFHYIPLIRENRVPNRYSILVTIGLAMLIAHAAWWLLARFTLALAHTRVSLDGRNVPQAFYVSHNEHCVKRKAKSIADTLSFAVCGLLSAVLLFEHLALPLPLTDARVPEVYRQIRREPGDFTVLSLPLGWRNSFGQLGAEDTRTQYYQAASEKFLLTGQLQRNPPLLFDYFARAPILRSIIALETYKELDENTWARDQAAAGEFVYFFDARYLVVNAAVANRPPYSDTRERVLQYAQQVLPLGEKVYDRGGTLAYKINQPAPPARLEIDFGTDRADLYQGEGWTAAQQVAGASANWSARQNARVFIPVREVKDYALTARALPFAYAGHTQTLTLALNGRTLETITLKQGWNEYKFTLPRDALHSGLNNLTWQFGYLVRPRDVLPANFEIGKTGVTSPVDIAVQSTSEYGSLKVNGREVSPLQRGYNFAVLDPQSGAVLQVKNFDTGGQSVVESRALTDFIAKLPAGVIVAGAAQEEASMLGERAAAAVKSLGLATDLRGSSGRTHAFIAVTGKPGALEASGAGPSAVNVGRNADDRWLGVAVDWMRVE